MEGVIGGNIKIEWVELGPRAIGAYVGDEFLGELRVAPAEWWREEPVEPYGEPHVDSLFTPSDACPGMAPDRRVCVEWPSEAVAFAESALRRYAHEQQKSDAEVAARVASAKSVMTGNTEVDALPS